MTEVHWQAGLSLMKVRNYPVLFPFTVMLMEFEATPGSLQENFLKRKKNFIQKSLKRVEGVKNREKENNKPEARQFQRGKSETSKKQKEGFLNPGRFIWAQDMALRILLVAVLYQRTDVPFAASLLWQTGILLSSQGCRELLQTDVSISCGLGSWL